MDARGSAAHQLEYLPDDDALRGHLGDLISAARVRAQLAQPQARGQRLVVLKARQRARDKAVRLSGRFLRRLDRALPLVECSVCGWRGSSFRPLAGPGYVLANEACPQCGSVQRQRNLLRAWQIVPPAGARCLYIAPEICLLEALRERVSAVTVDLVEPDVDVRADVQQLPVPDSSIDLIVCSDVLEHVIDDVAAMRELRRALSDHGVAFVHVPVNVTSTVDFGHALDFDFGHRRAYGPDIIERIRSAGLAYAIVPNDSLTVGDRLRHGLLRRDLVFVLARSTEAIARAQGGPRAR